VVAENSGMSVYEISCTFANNPHVESLKIFNNKKFQHISVNKYDKIVLTDA
jgi:hypothetical protein